MAESSVILYTQHGCAESSKVRRMLRTHGVRFVEHNVSRDADAAAALAQTGIFATPLLTIGKRTILGFRPAVIESALTEAGLWRHGEHRDRE